MLEMQQVLAAFQAFVPYCIIWHLIFHFCAKGQITGNFECSMPAYLTTFTHLQDI